MNRSSFTRDLGALVGAIDQGTRCTRFHVFSSTSAELVTYHEVPVRVMNPRQGWAEQDPEEIVDSVRRCIEATVKNLHQLDVDPADIIAIGLSNQRETTVVWDKETGKPLHNAIQWNDIRTQATVQDLLSHLPQDAKSQFYLQPYCGLPISSYFSAVKLRWLLDNVPSVAEALEEGRLLFGTVDSWIIYNLTGGINGGIHITDVTNASRTALMNLETLQWDSNLCRFFGVPLSVLPDIRSSSEIYGFLAETTLKGIPVSGCLGDQQAALVGQNCLRPGSAKCTYGTGAFVLYNVGPKAVFSEHGLLTTVAYKFGKEASAMYALEGCVAVAGAALQWLQEKMHMISNVADAEHLAAAAAETDVGDNDLCFVPAFSGLFAPHWRPDARGVLCGLTEQTGRGHVCRATLEALAFQVREILEAMVADSCGQLALDSLLVDGGMSQSNLLMQVQADLCGIPVLRSSTVETTALGAAIAAGSAKGVEVWDLRVVTEATADKFLPRLSEEERDVRFERWQEAVQRSLNWRREKTTTTSLQVSDRTQRMLSSIPAAVFTFSVVLLLKIAAYNATDS